MKTTHRDEKPAEHKADEHKSTHSSSKEMKEWVRREIMLAAHGADEEERKQLNP